MTNHTLDETGIDDHQPTRNEQEDGVDLESDAVFEVLKNRHRRYCCYYLSESTSDRTIGDELTSEVVAMEASADGDVPNEYHGRVAVSLHHCHLPKLAEYDLIEVDRDDEWVSLTAAAKQLSPYLEFTRRMEVPR